MTSLIGARKRAEEFDAALSSPGQAAATSPEMDSLLAVVAALRTQEAPAPRADFSLRLREQRLAEAAEVLTPSSTLALPPRRHGVRERRLTIAASAFVLIGGTAGMAAAAQSSAPGDALYPFKRGLENAQRSLERDDAAKGAAFLHQAGDRLEEARVLVDRDATSTQVRDSLRTFSTQAMTGSDLLLASFEEERDPALVQQVRDFSADSLAALTELAAQAPADLSDELAQVGYVLQRIDAAATDACTDCSDLPALEVSPAMAQTAAIQKAMRQVQMNPRIDNSHPAPAVKLPAASPSANPTTAPGSTDGGKPSTDPTKALDDRTAELPTDPKDLLGAVDDATGGLLGSVGDTTGKVLPGDLGKTTDDLLP
jgi:hypothetical protein